MITVAFPLTDMSRLLSTRSTRSNATRRSDWLPSAQHLHPAGDGLSDLMRRIFLEEMEPRDSHLGLRWQAAGKVEIRTAGDEQTGLGLYEQLGYITRRQPVGVGSRDRSHVSRITLDRDLPGPRQRRPPFLAGVSERPPVLGHLLGRKLTQDGPGEDLLDEKVILQDHCFASLGTQGLQSWAHIQRVPVVSALRPHDRLHVRDTLHRRAVAIGPVETES